MGERTMANNNRPQIAPGIVLAVALIGVLLALIVLVDGIFSISEQNIEQPYVHSTVVGDKLQTPQPTSTLLDIQVPDPYSGGS